MAALRPLSEPLCGRCGAPTAWPVERCLECAGRRLAFASARSAVAYTGPARPLIRAWKEGGLRPAAGLAAELVVSRIPAPAVDVVTPVPADTERLLERGHHPAGRLATELAGHWSLPCDGRLLARRRPSARQTGLGLAERGRNVRGAFTATRVVPREVLLVDDVYTTGATASAAASALRAAGAATVRVVTFARAVR